jgi:hypothetical protein
MNRKKVIVFFILISSLVASPAIATTDYCISSTGVVVIAGSTVSGATSHIVLAQDLTACSNLCAWNGGGRAGYIDFVDKDIYALALSSSFKSPRAPVTLVWEVMGSGKGVNGYTVTCRVLAINN